MKEVNKTTLEDALKQLPLYSPATGVWASIDVALKANPVSSLSSAVRELPAYTPPAKVWNQINHALSDANKQPRGLFVRSRQIVRWSASIAVAVLLFSAGYLVARLSQQQATVRYTVRQEPANMQNIMADWNDEEVSFKQVMEKLREVKDPYLQSLLTELEELTLAKQEAETMLRNYGNDHLVIRQLAEIETNRAQLYRQAINEL